jgi:hypothetical protein
MSRAAVGLALAGIVMTTDVALAVFAAKSGGGWPSFIAILLAGFSLALLILAYALRSARTICPNCLADIERDFLITAEEGKPAICKRCDGKANRYPWFTRESAYAIHRKCDLCGRVRNLAFLIRYSDYYDTSSRTADMPIWICRPIDSESCARAKRKRRGK